MAGVDANVEGGNSRLVRLRSMLAKPPSGAAMLVCHVIADPPLPVGEWHTDCLVPAMADELDALMVEQHLDTERAETKFSFSFLSDADERGGRRTLRVRTFNVRGNGTGNGTIDIAAGIVAQMDGSERGSNVLAQQTALQVARMFLAASQQKDELMFRVLDKLTERSVVNMQEADEARQQLHEYRELVVEVREAEREAERENVTPPEGMSPAQQQFWDLAAKSLPLVLAKLTAGKPTT